MMENYILQTIAFQLAFLLVYELLLKKETFFSYNRAYLLITPVLAVLMPFLKVTPLKNVISQQDLVQLPEVLLDGHTTVEASKVGVTPNLWLLVYAVGFLISLLLLAWKFYQLLQLSKKGKKSRQHRVDIIVIPNSTQAFSFNRMIFLGEELQAEEREQVLSHELVHVQQRHTIDLLFFELLRVLMWFNPLIYLFQKRITALHEYEADAGVVKKVEKQRYFEQLLNTGFGSQNISFVNEFYTESIIKKRIIMLQKTRSKTASKLKYLVLLPLILLMMVYVSSTEAMAQVSDTQTEVKNSQLVDVPFAVVDEVPVFPGCESLETRAEKKECFSNKITNFVNSNFNTGLGKELGLSGLNRVYVRFKISPSGEIVDIDSRASHPALGEEAERVIKMLPKMEPGKNRGKEVAVLYALPINFMVPEQKEEETQED